MLAEQSKAVTPIEVTEVLDRVEIPVIRITNPFNPREFVNDTFVWAPMKTLSDYFPVVAVESVVSINGRIVPAEEFAITRLDRADNIVVCPIPQGGGGSSKGILSLIAIIAISVVTAGAGAALAAGMGLTGTAATIAGGIMQAGIMMAGSALVHAIFAPSAPTQKSSGGTGSTYGIDGAKNTSLEGVPVPICYGKFRQAGNIVSLYTVNEGDSQTLYVLLNAGEGPVASLTDIRLNDNPIETYEGAEFQVRLGTADQPVIPWFQDTIVPHAIQQELTESYINYTTVGEIDKFRIDIVAGSGLFHINEDGGADTVTVPIEIEYRQLGGATWTSMSAVNHVTGNRAVEAIMTPVDGAYSVDGIWWKPGPDNTFVMFTPTTEWVYVDSQQPVSALDQAYIDQNFTSLSSGDFGEIHTIQDEGSTPVYSSALEVSAALRSTVRRSFESPQLPEAQYEIRVRRTTPEATDDKTVDKLAVSDINEILLDPVTYTNTALVGVKVTLGTQLSGMPAITFMNGGKMIAAFGKPTPTATTDQWYTAPSSNPAWVVWDMLTNKRYGGGMATTRLDFYAFKRWADYCDTEGLTWNGPIDTEMNVWDASQYVLRLGHSQLVNVGTRWTVVTEKPGAPVMMFSVANMVEDTYKETWLGMTDRANEVDVTFFDKNDAYKQRTIKIYDPAAITAGQKQRSSAITLYGCTDEERAYREGMFMMNLNRFILKTVNFQAPLEAIACSVGDLIYVQHDMPAWADAGRTEAGSTTSAIKLDRPVTLELGKSYKVLIHASSRARSTGVVTGIAGDLVMLSNWSTSAPVKRVVFGSSKDLRVLETYTNGVAVESVAGISVGMAYTAFDTDVIDEANVVVNPGTTDTLTLQAPLPIAPGQFEQWMFGEVERIKQVFRIKSISTGSDIYTREITALQYDERVWDTARFASQHVPTSTDLSEGVIGQVYGLEVYEESRISGSQIVSAVMASWVPPLVGTYAGADVYVKKNGAADWTITQINNRSLAEIDAVRGDVVTVRIVAFDLFGKRAPFDGAPEATYTVIGEVTDVDVGDVTGVDVIWNGRDCRLTWRYNSVTHAYEFGSEPVGADAGALDPQFQDYEITVFDSQDATAKVRRVEHVVDNSYTYTFDKNYADGLTRHLRFQIRMRDKFNNVGQPSSIVAYNPPPRVTSVGAVPTFESCALSIIHTADPDYQGLMVWVSADAADLAGEWAEIDPQFQIYDGPDNALVVPGLIYDTTYFFRVAAYDVFGKTELLPMDTASFHTTFLDVEAIAEGVLTGSMLIPELAARIDLVDGPLDMVNSVAWRLAQEAAARGAAITTESTIRQAAESSLASQITTLTASVNSNTAAISTEQTVRADAVSSMATQVNAVIAQSDANAAAIFTEQTARTDAVSSLSTQLNVVSATAGGKNKTYMQSTTPTVPSGGHTIGDLWIETDQDNKMRRWNGSSWVDASDVRTTDNAAAIISEQTARANADSANASSITALTTTVNGNTATLATQGSSINGLSAQYTVKIDINGYVSGYGLASTAVNGTPTSEFVIRADKFAMVMPSYPNVHPFTIGAVNGVPTVIMSTAIIGDLTVGTETIKNNAVTQPVAAFTAGGASVTSAGSIQSVTITTSGGAVLLNCGCTLTTGNSAATVGLVLKRGSTALWSINVTIDGTAGDGTSSAITAFSAPPFKDSPGAGTYTYSLEASSSQGANAQNRGMSAFEVKK